MNDLQALLAAVALAPQEDTPRLALADYLQENAAWADCPRCEGGRKLAGVDRTAFTRPPLQPKDLVSEGEDRAELVRIDVELRRIAPPDYGTVELGRYSCEQCWAVSDRDRFPQVPGRCPHCGHHRMRKTRVSDAMAGRRAELTRRSSELLARWPAWSRWPCPECVSGRVPGPDFASLGDIDTCPVCGGSGDLLISRDPASWRNDNVTTTQPLPGIDWEVGRLFPRTVTAATLGELVRDNCDGGCRVYGNIYAREPCYGNFVWQPTPRLRALASPSRWGVPVGAVMVRDKVAELFQRRDCTVVCSWFMQGLKTDPATLPEPVFDCLTDWCDVGDGRKMYPTAECASLALGRAMAAFAQKTTIPKETK